MSKAWYIVQTKPALEEQVRLRWSQVGYEVFLPKVRKIVRGSSGRHERLQPLFPSYLFACVDIEEAEIFRNLRYTRGVRRILGVGSCPLPVDREIIGVIQARVDEMGVLDEKKDFHIGDRVRVTHGPLADLIGVLERPTSSSGRIRVLLQVYQKTIRVELPTVDVEREEF